MQPEWIYSQVFYFKSRAGDKVRIFGCHNNKETNKQRRPEEELDCIGILLQV